MFLFMERVELNRGDEIKVHWVDVHENPVGDPDYPTIPYRKSLGIFWAYQVLRGVECLVTTTTEDEETHDSGFCAYPLGVVVKIEVSKKKRGRKSKPIRSRRGTSKNIEPHERRSSESSGVEAVDKSDREVGRED